MKRLHTGLIIFDTIDIICISFSAGSSIAYIFKRYKKYKKNKIKYQDPIINELKQQSPLIISSESGQAVHLPLIPRGGAAAKGYSLVLKNKKLAIFIRYLLYVKTKQKQLRVLRIFFMTFNGLLTSRVGLHFAVGGSLDYTQFLLFICPSSLVGFLTGLAIENPFASILLPLTILYSRGIEDIPNPYEKCRILCKFVEEFHNKQFSIEMKEFISLFANTSTPMHLPLETLQFPLRCVENEMSLFQRYKLRQVIESSLAQKRVQHFNNFIQKLPECQPDPEAIYEQFVEKILE